MSNQISAIPHTVFFVSLGDAMCPECYHIAYPDSTTPEAKLYTPVMSDGTGDDHHGLICDCGEEVDFSSGSMVVTGPRS